MRSRAGVTLFELLVVVAILAMIAVALNPPTPSTLRSGNDRPRRRASLDRLAHRAIAGRAMVTDTFPMGEGRAAGHASAFPDGDVVADSGASDTASGDFVR